MFIYFFYFSFDGDQTQVTMCNQFVDSTQCNSDGLPSSLSCFWLRGNASVVERESDTCIDKVCILCVSMCVFFCE
jgi:hypothetical protein